MYLLCVNAIELCKPLDPANNAELDERGQYAIRVYESMIVETKGLGRNQQRISVSE